MYIILFIFVVYVILFTFGNDGKADSDVYNNMKEDWGETHIQNF